MCYFIEKRCSMITSNIPTNKIYLNILRKIVHIFKSFTRVQHITYKFLLKILKQTPNLTDIKQH